MRPPRQPSPEQNLAAALVKGAVEGAKAGDARERAWLASSRALWPWITLLCPRDDDPAALQRWMLKGVDAHAGQ